MAVKPYNGDAKEAVPLFTEDEKRFLGALEAALVAADGLGRNGLWIPFHETGLPFSGTWLDFMDSISEGIAMPLGALIMSVWLGWFVGPKVIREEVEQEGRKMSGGMYSFFKFCIKFIAPLGMAFILYGQLTQFFTVS